MAAAEKYDWSYPLVAIDGDLKMAGGISFGMITTNLDKILESDEIEIPSLEVR